MWRAGHRFLAESEEFDHAHWATAAGVWFAQGERGRFRPQLDFATLRDYFLHFSQNVQHF